MGRASSYWRLQGANSFPYLFWLLETPACLGLWPLPHCNACLLSHFLLWLILHLPVHWPVPCTGEQLRSVHSLLTGEAGPCHQAPAPSSALKRLRWVQQQFTWCNASVKHFPKLGIFAFFSVRVAPKYKNSYKNYLSIYLKNLSIGSYCLI